MANMSDVKVLSKIIRRRVKPEEVDKIKKTLFSPVEIDMGPMVGVLRHNNDGQKCEYSLDARMYAGESEVCRVLIGFDRAIDRIRKQYSDKYLEEMMEFARRAVDKGRNKKPRGKTKVRGCKYTPQTSYQVRPLIGFNDDVCTPFWNSSKLLMKRDADSAWYESKRREMIMKYLKPSTPAHMMPGNIKFK